MENKIESQETALVTVGEFTLNPEIIDEQSPPIDDLAFANYFCQEFCDMFVFNSTEKQWYFYNGNVWEKDENGSDVENAIEAGTQLIVRYFADEVLPKISMSDATRKSIEKQFLAMHNFVNKGTTIERISKTLERKLKVKNNVFDKDTHLLNCLNGAVELCTKKLIPNTPKMLFRKTTGYNYLETADTKFWDDMVYNLSGAAGWEEQDKREQAEYIQKALGYSIFGGMNTENKFFYVYGKGGTGKSTLFGNVAKVLGDYGKTTESGMFVSKSSESKKERGLVYISQSRFVVFSEVGRYEHLDIETLKQMTGEEFTGTRKLFAETEDTAIEFTPWFMANNSLYVDATEDALWRRAVIITMDNKIPKPSYNEHKEFLQKVKDNLEGLLAWLVEGAYKYCQEGLKEPDCIVRATEAMRDGMNFVKGLSAEILIKSDDAEIAVKDLYERWRTYCQQTGEYCCSMRQMIEVLKKQGFKFYSSEHGQFMKGYSLKPHDVEFDNGGGAYSNRCRQEDDDEDDYIF